MVMVSCVTGLVKQGWELLRFYRVEACELRVDSHQRSPDHAPPLVFPLNVGDCLDICRKN
jgi:hypothetical protein